MNLDKTGFADTNVIILLCLLNHTTKAIQTLIHSSFKPLKTITKKKPGVGCYYTITGR
jgi:hypothetical protein